MLPYTKDTAEPDKLSLYFIFVFVYPGIRPNFFSIVLILFHILYIICFLYSVCLHELEKNSGELLVYLFGHCFTEYST